MITRSIIRAAIALFAAMCLATAPLFQALADTSQNSPSPRFIRDAEIESLLKLYSLPIFKAAGLTPGSVRVYIINNPGINAFVAGGQRIFVYTGLLMSAKTPNEVIGVLAHETGHIAGAHLARMGIQIDKASTAVIASMLLGAAAVGAGAATGSSGAAQAGQAVMMGGQGMANRLMLSYVRAQESAADQAAVKFLNATGQSGRGMLDLFQKLANQSIGMLNYVNPYVLSHPMPFERIRNLEALVKASPYFNKPEAPVLIARHQLMQAKLLGFLSSPEIVYQRFPSSDQSLPARYARAIAAFRIGDLKNAMPEIDKLIAAQPKYPYFWELKGQALLDSGRAADAVAPLEQAVKLSNNNGLISILYAQALLDTENKANAAKALATLKFAQRTEGDSVQIYTFLAQAYGRLGDIPNAELATAEAAFRRGDKQLAVQKAKIALKTFGRGSTQWLRANDILNFADRD